MGKVKLTERDADHIVIKYLLGWATLNTRTSEDFYNGFSMYYFPEGYEGKLRLGAYSDCAVNEHTPTAEEAQLIAAAFDRMADKLRAMLPRTKKHLSGS